MKGRILRKGINFFEEGRIDGGGVLIDGSEYYGAFHRAASLARRYILISGWQFDSEVSLLRGNGGRPRGEVRFLRFLDSLCRENSELRIYILAWDFSIIFMLEREWMQEIVFNWSTSQRLMFRFDEKHAIGASQHQKYAVIDGAAAFLGGMDICAGRWDDRRHLADNPARFNPDGGRYAPYHDIQAYIRGPLAARLAEIFAERWRASTGTAIELAAPLADCGYIPEGAGMALPARRAALSRTQGQTFTELKKPVKEVRALYADAIRSARKLVYIENQYFSSHAVYRALKERMEETKAPKLDIAIVLPREPNALVEELSVGLLQARILTILRQTAERTGHRFGVYYSTAFDDKGDEVPVYIHSKLLIVDDRFLTIGSANTTNRSMGLDTELNIAWEAAGPRDRPLSEAIRSLRASLLMEHIGGSGPGGEDGLMGPSGLVGRLDAIADARLFRLQRHSFSPYFEGSEILKAIDELLLDPEKAVIEENVFEIFSPDIVSVFGEGIKYLKRWLLRRRA